MAIEAYYQSRRIGLKTYNRALQNNQDPYLPTLQERCPEFEGLPRVNLGVMPIQIDRIVGTVTQGRSSAFASDFMPLLEPESEFAAKWGLLYEAVVESGVRDPVSVIEYMGDYYLLEGNKRVSVMRALGSSTIEADVTRYVAPRTDTAESKAYYAYMDFVKLTGVYEILFSKESEYKHLLAITGHSKDGKWSEDARKELRAVYLNFADRYCHLFKKENSIPVTDAFMAFLVAYGYRQITQKSFIEVDADIQKMRNEFRRGASGEAVSIIMDKDQRAGRLLNALFGPSKIKAAFLYTRSPMESGWNHWHDVGRLNMENTLGDRVETSTHIISSRNEFEGRIEELIKEGNRLIFATSPVMLNSCIKPSLEHPEANLLCCSLLASYNNVRSYYLRIYEAKFLLGLAAGMMARGGDIGYIADYPIYGSAASINAFALGARMVNPSVKVYLKWSTVKDFDEKTAFDGLNIKVISNRDITAPSQGSLEYGLYVRDEGVTHNLAMPVYDWGTFYSYIGNSLLRGTLDEDKNGVSALDYWWGMSSDALDIQLADNFDVYGMRLINMYKNLLTESNWSPFSGLIVDNKGIVRCAQEQALTPAQVMCMDYLVDNVVGGFPDFGDLADIAVPITRLQGIKGDRKPDVSKISWLMR